jgi:curved DNA-binding protein
MVLKQEVINAFKVLDIDPATTTVEKASTAYKKLALKHHPDRNYGDPSANERFQEVNNLPSLETHS